MGFNLASFPGRSHRQYFIASSMKCGGARPLRSGQVRCHQVDTWRRVVPNEESQHPVLYCPSKGWMSERSQGRRSFVVHNARDGSMRTAPHVSTICLSEVIACDQISQAFPTASISLLPYFILEVMKYWWWERPENKASCNHCSLLS